MIQELTYDDGMVMFDQGVRKLYGDLMSGQEWLRRYDAGEFDFEPDSRWCDIQMLLPFVRPTPTTED